MPIEDIREYVRVGQDVEEEDGILTTLHDAAVEAVEQESGTFLRRRQIEVTGSGGGWEFCIELPRRPLIEVTSLQAENPANGEVIEDFSSWTVEDSSFRTSVSAKLSQGVRGRFDVRLIGDFGFDPQCEAAKQAILIQIAHLHRNREDETVARHIFAAYNSYLYAIRNQAYERSPGWKV